MNEISVERTPHTIATQIYGIKGQARQVILYSSVEIGRLLVEAKSLVAHGEWGDWLKNSVDYSQSTANNLMQLYREYGDSSDKLQNLSYTKAIALLGVPADEREDFIAVNDIESMSSRDLLQAIKDKQLLEEQLQESNTAQQELAKKLKDTEKRSRDRSLEVERLKTEISGAQESGNKIATVKLQAALDKSEKEHLEAQAKVKELEAELKKKPIDVPATIEKIPEAIEIELADLRKKAAQPNTAAAITFKVQFEALGTSFKALLSTLEEVKAEDTASHEKYKGAVSGLLSKMIEKL